MTPPFGPLIDARGLRRELGAADLCVFDCRFSLSDPAWGRRAHAEGHVPGSHYAHLDAHLSGPIGPRTGRHPLPDPARLAAWLGSCGVSAETRVVAYDDMGGAFAVRLWWLLRWLGHRSAAVLDGGLQAWTAAGGAVSTDAPEHPAALFATRIDDGLWIDSETLAAALQRHAVQVIDARAPERFRGEQEPIDPVAGHIPGAVNLPLTGNLDASGRFLPGDQLHHRFTQTLGPASPPQVVHSCGSGVNACHNLLAMELAGLPGSRLYAGSWSEWIRDPERPIATGAG